VKKVAIPLKVETFDINAFPSKGLREVFLQCNADAHSYVEWQTHLTKSEDALILEYDRNFGEHEASVVRYDTPEKVLLVVSHDLDWARLAADFQDTLDTFGKGNEYRVFTIASICLCYLLKRILRAYPKTHAVLDTHLSPRKRTGTLLLVLIVQLELRDNAPSIQQYCNPPIQWPDI
jgi:hypothetical protein